MSSIIKEKEKEVNAAVIREENIRLKLVGIKKQKQAIMSSSKNKQNNLTSEEYRIKLDFIQLQIKKIKSEHKTAKIDVSRSKRRLAWAKRGPKENM